MLSKEMFVVENADNDYPFCVLKVEPIEPNSIQASFKTEKEALDYIKEVSI